MNSHAMLSAHPLQRTKSQVRTIAAIIVISLTVSGSALAESSEQAAEAEQRQLAHEHFNRGVVLATQHNYAQALREFQEAYRESPHYAVQYNIGQARIVLGQPVEAVDALEHYLTEGGSQITESRILEVRSQIAAARALIAEVTLSVNVPDSTIRIDGHDIGHAPLVEPIRLAAGSHLISVSAPDGTQLSRPVTLQGMEKLALQFELPTASQTIPPPVSQAAARMNSSSSARTEQKSEPSHVGTALDTNRRISTLGYTFGIVGLALGAFAFGDYLWNRGRYAQWRTTHTELQTDQQAPDYVQRQLANNNLASSIQRASNVTVGLSVASGLLTATGVSLVILDRLGRVTVVPSPQDHTALLTLRGVW